MSTADRGRSIGQVIKYADFIRVIDLDLTPEQAASIVELIETATAERWATITAQVNKVSGKKYEVPSPEGVAALAAVYRMRRQLPVADFDAAGLAIQIERRLARLASGEEDAADVALAAKYVAAFDKSLWRSTSPAKMADRLASYSAGWWWHRSKEMGEKYAPSAEVVRLVIATYRDRAGPVVAPVAPVVKVRQTCTICRTREAETGSECDSCLMGSLTSSQTLADQGEAMRESDRQQALAKRFGGSR